MSSMELFYNKGKHEDEIIERAFTNRFIDENGEPVKWKVKRLSIDEIEDIRKDSAKISLVGNRQTVRVDSSLFSKKLGAESVIYPNLLDAGLQDSYGVKTAEALITKLFDTAGEYDAFIKFLMELNGFKSFDEEVKEAKN